MLKTKDGYAKLIGTTYQGSSDYLLLSDGTSTPISGLRVNYASSAGNADTLDGEHANDFVRAGNIYSNNTDLNALDTYSFIKSVYSTVVGTSPKGNTGWYNIIQAVYKNGVGDGTNYMGQIALGMTTNVNGMFYRTKNNGSWNIWNEVLTTNTGLLKYSRNNVNISSSNCSPIPPSLLEWTIGYPRLYDPEFVESSNDVMVYNNANNGVVTIERAQDSNVGNYNNWVLKVVSASGASPYCGGWHVSTQTELGKVYTCLFRASIPSGVEITFNTNSVGNGGQWSWLTDSVGTGKWTWYAAQVYCGSGGSTTFFFATKSPCTWYLSYVNVIENNKASYAGLRSVYSDYLKQNANLVFGRNELQYFNQYTGVTSGARDNANPTKDWYHILRMNHSNSNGYFVDLAIPFNNNRIQFRRIVGGSDVGWYRVITEEPNHDVLLCDSDAGGNVGIGTSSPTQKLDVLGNIRASGQIVREFSSVSWNEGREGALLRETSSAGYHTLWSLKTANGSWDFGEYNHGSDWEDVPLLSYVPDKFFNEGPNGTKYQIRFPLASGTVALTSNIPNPTNYYWANVKISDSSSTETSPTVKTLTATRVCAGHDPEIDNSISCSNWFRSSGNTGWYNTTYSGGWYMSDTSWIRAHNDVGIYTGGQIYSSTSIRMGDIYLQNGNEINTSTSDLYLNYLNAHNVRMCNGGGSVVIGPAIDNVNDNKLYVNGAATIAGPATIVGSTTLTSTALFNGLVTNKGGILPASYDVNNNGTACYVWGDAMSTGVTAITDALDPRYVTVVYSRDNGYTWTDYSLTNYDKFSLYANNGSYVSIYLGNSSNEGNLAPVQINQLMVTFEIPDSLYSALCWASVDIGNGVTTVCTVEIIAKDGTIQNTFTKTMYGWNKFNYINFWGTNDTTVDIGRTTSRFVRFKFKHDASNKQLRNAQIRKIRLFSFTKYSIDPSDFRNIMGNTGHLYKYDENLNVTFPNTLKTTALEVSGNASFYDLYCKTLNYPSSTGTLVIGDKTQEVGIRSLSDPTINALYLKNRLSSNVIFSANKGFSITPYYLSDNPYTDNPATISGYKYKVTTIGNGTTTISCIIASKCFIPPSFGTIRGYLIRFLPGNDGQIVILKNLYTEGNGSELPIYVRPEGCDIIAADRSSIYIKNGTLSTSFNDDGSRFFIYVTKYNAWIEFYCG